MKKKLFPMVMVSVIILLVSISGCKESTTEPQNRSPKIESLTANPITVLINSETTITCIATDEDKDNLTITWSSKRGTFPNGVVGISVKWLAPSTAGTDTINVVVNDGKQTIQGKVVIVVGTISSSPTLLTPSNSATEISLSPTLYWNVVSNAVTYTLHVSANSSFSSFVFNQSGLTTTNQVISNLNSNSTYYWRVNSTNIFGTSDWSSVFSFKTLAPPNAPTLLTPSNYALDVPITLTLSWNVVSQAVSYTLQVSNSNTFSSYVFNQNVGNNISQQISGLSTGTRYYWRVSAANIYGSSSFTNPWFFATASEIVGGGKQCQGIPNISYAGKTYNTVQIGNQCWLKENLDVGLMIQVNQNPSNNTTIEKYCYENNPANCANYGGLYQWAEAVQYKNGATNSTSPNPAFSGNVQGICPAGWHIPSVTEFETLMGSSIVNGNSYTLLARGQGTDSGIEVNSSGFSALLAGHVLKSNFNNIGIVTQYWSSRSSGSTNATGFTFSYYSSHIGLSGYEKDFSCSVRCIKD